MQILVIDTKGTYLSRKNGMLEIKQAQESKRIALEGIQTIFISKGILLTTDVMLLALENQIDIIIVDSYGNPRGRVWNNKFGSIAAIRRNQVLFANQSIAIPWIQSVILEKINNQINFLHQLRFGQLPNGTTSQMRIMESIEMMQKIAEKLQNIKLKKSKGDWKNTLRGWEGSASRIYFQTLAFSVPHYFQFEGRVRPAKDMFNCMLNYGYGMLYGYVEGALLKTGIDPTLGILHADEYNKPTMVFDMIEPYRIWVDTVVVRLCLRYGVSELDFVTHGNGLWISGKGKKILIGALQDYLQEVIPRKGNRRSRLNHIFLDAQAFAQMLLEMKKEV